MRLTSVAEVHFFFSEEKTQNAFPNPHRKVRAAPLS